jgi:hypothetical protein
MSSSRRIPVDVCNALLILGVPSDGVTEHLVINAWKRQIVEVHPDKGTDTETAIILNTAKDCILNWLDLGPDQQSPVTGRPYPSAGEGQLQVALPLPESLKDNEKV